MLGNRSGAIADLEHAATLAQATEDTKLQETIRRVLSELRQ
jgi:hypothetical protein